MENGKEPAFTAQGNFDYPPIPGLTKREYFAGLAFQAMICNPSVMQAVTASQFITGDAAERISKMSVKYSDELLKALEKEL